MHVPAPFLCAPAWLPHCFFSNVPRFSFPGRPPLPSGRGGPSPVAPGPGRFARTEAKPVPCGRLGRFLRFVYVFQSVPLKEPNRNLHPLVPFEPGARVPAPFFIQAAMPARPGERNGQLKRGAGKQARGGDRAGRPAARSGCARPGSVGGCGVQVFGDARAARFELVHVAGDARLARSRSWLLRLRLSRSMYQGYLTGSLT